MVTATGGDQHADRRSGRVPFTMEAIKDALDGWPARSCRVD